MKKLVLSLALILSVTSCARIISGKTEQVKVTSNPETSDCTYSNENETGAFKTPSVITLTRTRKYLTITCNIPGYGTGTETVPPGANYWLLANVANFGLGYFYDVADGDSWDYPSEVHVVLQPTGGVQQGNFMMKGYNNQAVIPAANIPQMQQGYGAMPATNQQQNVQQPVSQQQLMADMVRDRELITSDEELKYTPPSFDQQNQMQLQAQQQGYMQAQQIQQQQAPQPAQQQWIPTQPQVQQVAPQQKQLTPYEIYIKQREQEKLRQQYQTSPMMPSGQLTPRMP